MQGFTDAPTKICIRTSLPKTLLYHKKSTPSRRVTKVKPFDLDQRRIAKLVYNKYSNVNATNFRQRGLPGRLFAGAPLKTQECVLAAKLGVSIVGTSLKGNLYSYNKLAVDCLK